MSIFGTTLCGDWIPLSERTISSLDVYESRKIWLIIETSGYLLPERNLNNVDTFNVLTFPPRPQNCDENWLNAWKWWRDILATHPGNLSSGPYAIHRDADGGSPTTQPTSSKHKNTFKQFIRKTMNTGSSL